MIKDDAGIAATSSVEESRQDDEDDYQPQAVSVSKKFKQSTLSHSLAAASATTSTGERNDHKPQQEVRPCATKKKQSRITFSHAGALTPARSEHLTTVIASMIAIDLQPLSMVEDQGFRQLMEVLVPQYQMPSRGTIRRRIELQHSEMRNFLLERLTNEASFLALTTDAWTSCHNESYVAVTAHYLNDSWTLQNYLLEVAEMTERHTADNLSERITGIIENWNVEGRVSAIVHDNAANIVAAMRNVATESVTCSAHNLQLAIQKGLQDTLVTEIIAKASAVVGHFSHSTIAATELEKKQNQLNLPVHRLVQCVSTRWNSVFLMFQRLLEQKAAIAAVLNDSTVTISRRAVALEIKQQEWKIITDLTNVLKPMQIATTTLCSETETTSGSVLPIVTKLHEKFLSVTGNESATIQNFKQRAAVELMTKFKLDADDLWQSPLAIASFLDPRYKNLSFLNESNRADIWALVLSRLNEQQVDATAIGRATPSALDFLLADETDDESQSTMGEGMQELERYKLESCINRNDEPLTWWRNSSLRFPLLSKLAKQYLCIPATSAASERAFSSSGNIATHRRSTLSSEMVQSLVFLHHNIKKS